MAKGNAIVYLNPSRVELLPTYIHVLVGLALSFKIMSLCTYSSDLIPVPPTSYTDSNTVSLLFILAPPFAAE